MENQVQKFDPAALMQGVKDRIKSTFVSLIPDEQWEQMVQKEINDFFQEKVTGYQNSREYKSDFQLLVRNLLNDECRKRLIDYLASPEFQTTWDTHGKEKASEAIKQMFIENSGAMITNFFAGIFNTQLNNMRNQMQYGH